MARHCTLCNVCKSVLHSELSSEYHFGTLRNDDLAKHLKECEFQFLDTDDYVKSCFQFYIEQLIEKYRYSLTPHYNKNPNKCSDCWNKKAKRLSDIKREEVGSIMDLSKECCSKCRKGY